jgi:hypothetical protein
MTQKGGNGNEDGKEDQAIEWVRSTGGKEEGKDEGKEEGKGEETHCCK